MLLSIIIIRIMAGHPNFEAILISVKSFNLTISHSIWDIKCYFKVLNSHLI